MQYITPRKLADELARRAEAGEPLPLLIDVREPWEWNLCHIPGSLHLPMHLIPAKMNEFDPNQEIVCICHSGARSAQVVQFLQRHGFGHAINLLGGVEEWANSVDPTMPHY